MVLAHLRGLLRPDYKMGVRSHVREELVLEALGREMKADFLDGMSNLLITGAGKPIAQETLGKIQDMIDKSNRLRSLNGLNPKRNIDGLAAIYNALRKSKIAQSV